MNGAGRRSLIAGVSFAAIVILAVIMFTAQQSSESQSISPFEAKRMLLNDSSVVLLDVRTDSEHWAERIAETPLIPVQSLENRLDELKDYRDKTIIVYCRSGNRSGTATRILRQHGYRAFNMQGGIIQWKYERFPTTIGRSQ